jgi:hypothetical protein
VTVTAHHALVQSLPFVVPVIVALVGIAVLTLRDRMRRPRE